MRAVADRMRLVGKVGGWVWAGFCFFFQVSVDDCIDAFLASREGLSLKACQEFAAFVSQSKHGLAVRQCKVVSAHCDFSTWSKASDFLIWAVELELCWHALGHLLHVDRLL